MIEISKETFKETINWWITRLGLYADSFIEVNGIKAEKIEMLFEIKEFKDKICEFFILKEFKNEKQISELTIPLSNSFFQKDSQKLAVLDKSRIQYITLEIK